MAICIIYMYKNVIQVGDLLLRGIDIAARIDTATRSVTQKPKLKDFKRLLSKHEWQQEVLELRDSVKVFASAFPMPGEPK